jgi:hypothetical protein
MFGKATAGHWQTKSCKEGTLRKDLRDMRRRQRHERKRFKIGEEEIGTVREFKYLGRITSDDDDDLPAVKEFEEGETEVGPESREYLTRDGK